MNRDDIMRMARDAGFNPANYMGGNLEIFERFAVLIMTYNSNLIAEWVKDWGDQVSLEKLVEGIRNGGNDTLENYCK